MSGIEDLLASGAYPIGAQMNPSTAAMMPGMSDIQLKRLIMGQMLAASMPNGQSQVAGGMVVKQNPLAIMAQMLSMGILAKGLKDSSGEEQQLIQQQAAQSADAAAQLSRTVAGKPGTPATMEEMPGPPTPAGDISIANYPGTPGRGPSPEEFSGAYQKARYAGVDPAMLATALQDYQTNQRMDRFGLGQYAPWNGQQGGSGSPVITPGNANRGAIMSMPQESAGGSSGAAPGGGSVLPGLTNQQFAMMLDPHFKEAGKLSAEMTKPQPMQPGAAIYGYKDGKWGIIGFSPKLAEGQVIGPDGTVQIPPNYAETNAQLQRQRQSVDDESAMVTIQFPDKSSRTMSVADAKRSGFIGNVPQNAPSAPSAPQGYPSTSGLPGMPPAPPNASYAPTLSASERALAQRDFQSRGAAPGEQWGYQNGRPTMQPGSPNAAQQSAYDARTAQETDIAKGFAKDYLSIIDAERQAPQNIAKYGAVKDYLSKVATGKLAPEMQAFKQYVAYIAPDLAKNWTQDVPFAQAAQQFSREIALKLRNPAGGAGMPGNLSDSDRRYLESMVPGWENDPRAITMMMDAMAAVERRNQDIGRMAREYRQSNKTIDEGFYQRVQDYANANDLFPKIGKGGATGTWGDKPPVSSSVIDALVKRYTQGGR